MKARELRRWIECLQDNVEIALNGNKNFHWEWFPPIDCPARDGIDYNLVEDEKNID